MTVIRQRQNNGERSKFRAYWTTTIATTAAAAVAAVVAVGINNNNVNTKYAYSDWLHNDNKIQYDNTKQQTLYNDTTVWTVER